MKKKRNIFTLVLAVSLVFALLAGCSNGNAPAPGGTSGASSGLTTDQTSQGGQDNVAFPLTEPYTVRAFAFSAPGEELDKSLFMKTMEEKTNVKWDLTLASEAEIVEKLGLSFNSGDYYDVYLKSGISKIDTQKYAQQEIILPLNDLIDRYMPNLKAALDTQDVWSEITSGDGKIYSFPQLNGRGIAAPSVFINQPWLDAVGKQMPKTEDEFLDVLRAFRDSDPNRNGEKDEYPLYCPNGGVDILMPYFGIAMDGNTMSMYDSATGKIKYVPTSEEYKNFLRFMSKLYKEKLINQDCFTATWDELSAMGTTKDVVGAFPQWGAYLVTGNEKDENFPMLMPFHEKSFPMSSGVGYGGIVITDKCKKPEVIARWADYLYSEEGGRLAWMGVEGKTYTVSADGKYHWNTDGTYGTDIASIRNTQGLFGNKNAPCIAPKLFDEGQDNPEELFLYKERVKIKAYGADPFPALSWSDAAIKEKSDLVAAINPYFAEYEAKVISGQLDLDASWDQYIQTMKGMGVDKLNEIDQEAYTKWLAENHK